MQIFELFSQGDGSAAREQGGTGLGLAITQQLVELHGGTIGVRVRRSGVGSRFTFTPATQLDHARAMLTPPDRPGQPVSQVLADVRLDGRGASAPQRCSRMARATAFLSWTTSR